MKEAEYVRSADDKVARIIAARWGPCIKTIVEDSEKVEKEIATAVCDTGGRIGLFGDKVMGNDSGVPRTSRCFDGERVGEIHTHPGVSEQHGLSKLDLESFAGSSDHITCSLTPKPDGSVAVVCAEKVGDEKIELSVGEVGKDTEGCGTKRGVKP